MQDHGKTFIFYDCMVHESRFALRRFTIKGADALVAPGFLVHKTYLDPKADIFTSLLG